MEVCCAASLRNVCSLIVLQANIEDKVSPAPALTFYDAYLSPFVGSNRCCATTSWWALVGGVLMHPLLEINRFCSFCIHLVIPSITTLESKEETVEGHDMLILLHSSGLFFRDLHFLCLGFVDERLVEERIFFSLLVALL